MLQLDSDIENRKNSKNKTPGVTTSPIRGHTLAEYTKPKFGMKCRVADIIICFNFFFKIG